MRLNRTRCGCAEQMFSHGWNNVNNSVNCINLKGKKAKTNINRHVSASDV